MCIEIKAINVPVEILRSIPPGGQLWVQSGRVLMITHPSDHSPSQHNDFLTGYDFTEETGECPQWLPGGS